MSQRSETVQVPEKMNDWQEVKVVQNEHGTSELIIENLENLNEQSTLILKRQGSKFKIGFATPQ